MPQTFIVADLVVIKIATLDCETSVVVGFGSGFDSVDFVYVKIVSLHVPEDATGRAC